MLTKSTDTKFWNVGVLSILLVAVCDMRFLLSVGNWCLGKSIGFIESPVVNRIGTRMLSMAGDRDRQAYTNSCRQRGRLHRMAHILYGARSGSRLGRRGW